MQCDSELFILDERPDLSTAELKLKSQKQERKKKEKKVRLKNRNASIETPSEEELKRSTSGDSLGSLANIVITTGAQVMASIR